MCRCTNGCPIGQPLRVATGEALGRQVGRNRSSAPPVSHDRLAHAARTAGGEPSRWTGAPGDARWPRRVRLFMQVSVPTRRLPMLAAFRVRSAALVLAAVTAGCSSDPSTPDDSSGKAELTVVHASPALGLVDVRVADYSVVNGLAYGRSSGARLRSEERSVGK